MGESSCRAAVSEGRVCCDLARRASTHVGSSSELVPHRRWESAADDPSLACRAVGDKTPGPTGAKVEPTRRRDYVRRAPNARFRTFPDCQTRRARDASATRLSEQADALLFDSCDNLLLHHHGGHIASKKELCRVFVRRSSSGACLWKTAL